MVFLFRFVGALGVLLISAGILSKKRGTQDLFYILGGVCLEAYSIYIGDDVFIILQLIFTGAAVYDYVKCRNT
ncbi:MAG: hypothetical protein ABH851_01470 [Methanobacteriota archaeon]